MGSPPLSGKVLRFGVFELDPETQQLRKAGVLLRLQPQPLKVLLVLISRAGQIVSREELRHELWGGETFVDFEQGLNYCIRHIRATLGDEAQTPRYVETIPRRGFRFIAPVEGLAQESPADWQPEAVVEKSVFFRRTWLALGASVLLATLASAVYVLRLRSAPHLTEKDTVVVADFVNKTGDPLFDDILKQATAIHLEQSPFLNILSDERVAATFKLMNRPSERLTLNVAREVCLRSNSKAMLAGSIALVGTHYLLGLRAVDCQTGDTLASAEAEAENRDKVLNALQAAGNQMRQKLGESLSSVNRFNKPLTEATTSSLEALKAYTRAAPSDRPEALADLKRAVELDPDFAVAYASMGVRYANFNELALASQSFKKAYQLRDRVSERERFYIEASYYTIVTGQLEQANQTYLLWTREYPKEAGSYVNLSFNYMAMGYYEKALEMAQESLRASPDFSVGVGNLAADYVALGRLEEAKAVFDRAVTRGQDGVDAHVSRYYVAFLEQDNARMQEQAAWAMDKAGLEDQLLSIESDTAAYYGHLAQAHDLSGRALNSARRNGAPETAAFWEANDALHSAEFGEAASARHLALDALALDRGPSVRLAATLALARAGDAERAQSLADALEKEFPVNTLIQAYWLPTIRAAVELDQGNPSRAIELLRVTSPYDLAQTMQFPLGTMYPVYLRGLANLKAGQAQEASREFQKILDHGSVVANFPLASLAHLQLARAQAMSHDNPAARKAYQDFLTLWKDADADIPILKEAKAEYTKLQ